MIDLFALRSWLSVEPLAADPTEGPTPGLRGSKLPCQSERSSLLPAPSHSRPQLLVVLFLPVLPNKIETKLLRRFRCSSSALGREVPAGHEELCP